MKFHSIVARRRAALVLAAWATFACAPAVAGETPPPRTIRVSGEGVAKAAPDRARVAVSVTSRATTAREASEANARTSKTVLEKLRALARREAELLFREYARAPNVELPELSVRLSKVINRAATAIAANCSDVVPNSIMCRRMMVAK